MKKLGWELESLYGGIHLRKSGALLFITSTEKDFFLTDYEIGYDYMGNADETFWHFKEFVRYHKIWRWTVREIFLDRNIVKTNINFKLIFPNLQVIWTGRDNMFVYNNNDVFIK